MTIINSESAIGNSAMPACSARIAQSRTPSLSFPPSASPSRLILNSKTSTSAFSFVFQAGTCQTTPPFDSSKASSKQSLRLGFTDAPCTNQIDFEIRRNPEPVHLFLKIEQIGDRRRTPRSRQQALDIRRPEDRIPGACESSWFCPASRIKSERSPTTSWSRGETEWHEIERDV
jgi:hypothetical protein